MASLPSQSIALPLPVAETPRLGQRLLSVLHALRIGLDDWRHRPRPYREVPAGWLEGLDAATQARIHALQARHHADFEQHLNRPNALENYVYLDLLDRLFAAVPISGKLGSQTVLDVGSKNFYYARALWSVFRPRGLVGLEIEGHRRYSDGHCRRDYADYYVAGLPGARYLVGDLCRFAEQAELVSCWYPFVHQGTALHWGLPLSAFDPATFFRQLALRVRPGGHLLMVNQGREEWRLARQWLRPQGLSLQRHLIVKDPLLPRPAPPVISWWRRD